MTNLAIKFISVAADALVSLITKVSAATILGKLIIVNLKFCHQHKIWTLETHLTWCFSLVLHEWNPDSPPPSYWNIADIPPISVNITWIYLFHRNLYSLRGIIDLTLRILISRFDLSVRNLQWAFVPLQNCIYLMVVNVLEWGFQYSWRTVLILNLPMAWFCLLPKHKQAWEWLCKSIMLCFIKLQFNTALSILSKWYNVQIYIWLLNNSASKDSIQAMFYCEGVTCCFNQKLISIMVLISYQWFPCI